MEALNLRVIHSGAELVPQREEDHETIRGLYENATANGVEVHLRESDGALLVPGESVTDPVAFTQGLARSAEAVGGRIELQAKVTGIDPTAEGLTLRLADGGTAHARVVINAAGLHADDVARLVGDDSFEIYPRKGEFFVFELPENSTLDRKSVV